MILSDARAIAEKVKAQLAPFCERIEIAGSIRREKPEVKDIEICYVVRTRDLLDFIVVVNKWRRIKGHAGTGFYTQRILPDGINLDLFRATRENWGLIFAIRTGSADFSHYVLASGWVKQGYKSEKGMLRNIETNQQRPVFEEQELFQLIGVPYIDPKQREP